MQTPALFKPMSLGAGFGEFDDYNFDFSGSTNTFDYQPSPYDTPVYDEVINTVNQPDVFDLPIENIAIVDNSGNVNDQNGKPVISADAITRIAMNNPGREGEAIAQAVKNIAPDWTKQFKSTDELVKAAYNLFNTTKAVIQGKPIPQSIRSPYVYNPNDPNMVKRTTTAMPPISTNMLLIGGVALAAFLVLRKK